MSDGLVKTHSHGSFVYGVIVGLAIREALIRVVPHTIPSIVEAIPAQPSDPKSQIALEATRLIVFLAVTIRFYVGAGIYFERVHCTEKSDENFKRKNYGLDFLLGTIHFIILFIWSQTVISHTRLRHGMSGFLLLLGIVLLYDLVWWGLSLDYDTMNVIRRWALLNAATVVLSLLVVLILDAWELTSVTTAEAFALVPVGLMTLVDFGEMFGGKNVLTSRLIEWFKS